MSARVRAGSLAIRAACFDRPIVTSLTHRIRRARYGPRASFRGNIVMSGEQRLVRPDKPAPRLRSGIDFGLISFALPTALAIVVGPARPDPEWMPVQFLTAP
jgi:hypothetical protein